MFGCGESGGRRRPGAGPQRRAKEARQPAVDDGEPCENQRHAGQRHEGDALAEDQRAEQQGGDRHQEGDQENVGGAGRGENAERSEERRVGKEYVSTCSSRWSRDHYKKQTKTRLTTTKS